MLLTVLPKKCFASFWQVFIRGYATNVYIKRSLIVLWIVSWFVWVGNMSMWPMIVYLEVLCPIFFVIYMGCGWPRTWLLRCAKLEICFCDTPGWICNLPDFTGVVVYTAWSWICEFYILQKQKSISPEKFIFVVNRCIICCILGGKWNGNIECYMSW